MEKSIFRPHSIHMEFPGVVLVSAGSPFEWLRNGWQDMRRSLPVSLGYGLVFALLGYLLLSFAWPRLHLAMALTSGFLLVAPLVALGFYDLSRQIESRAKPSLAHALTAWRRNSGSVGMYVVLLLFILVTWERLSAIIVGLFLGGNVTDVTNLFGEVIGSGEHLPFLAAYALFGLAMAGLVFAISVASLPMLLDRDIDLATAVMTSLWVVRENPLPMLVWAAIIAGLIALGYLAFYIGLVLVFPLLGHATWHAYRALVESN